MGGSLYEVQILEETFSIDSAWLESFLSLVLVSGHAMAVSHFRKF